MPLTATLGRYGSRPHPRQHSPLAIEPQNSCIPFGVVRWGAREGPWAPLPPLWQSWGSWAPSGSPSDPGSQRNHLAVRRAAPSGCAINFHMYLANAGLRSSRLFSSSRAVDCTLRLAKPWEPPMESSKTIFLSWLACELLPIGKQLSRFAAICCSALK